MRYKWKWFNFTPVLGFYLIPKSVRSEIEQLTDTYSGYDAVVYVLICLESLFVLIPLLMWGIG